MQVKIKLKIKTFEKVLGALDLINSSVKGESYKNKIILKPGAETLKPSLDLVGQL